jgi:hypothetical protein
MLSYPMELLKTINLFVQVLRVVKTKQVTYAILLQLSEYVKSLEAGGLLESKETTHLHDAVQVLASKTFDPAFFCLAAVVSMYMLVPISNCKFLGSTQNDFRCDFHF